jgi:hypothetical protein
MKKNNTNEFSANNLTIIFILICCFIILYLMFNAITNQNIIINNTPSEKILIQEQPRENYGWPFFMKDPLLNPYAPPLRDERYLPGVTSGVVPINVSTNVGAVDTTYRQLGLLTPIKGTSKDNILPLMGRPLFTNRDKWNYYSTSNQHNNIKLPLIHNGRSCTNEYGCDKLFNGDVVYIEGINERYKVTLYDNDTMKYLPFI